MIEKKAEQMKSMYTLIVAAASMAVMANVAVQASDLDDRIESSFKQTYVYTTYLKDDKLKMASENGAVTLSGTVAEESHKSLAQETAANLAGVVSVDNKLATTAEVTAENADIWMARKIKVALVFHRNVNAGKTTVVVKDGVVTLTGEASSIAQKDLTTEYASDIEGVKEVKNAMTVATTPESAERTEGQKIDDASITAQVKTALWTHRSTHLIGTKIVTRNGEVMLTGIAKNDAEKSLVSKLVADIQGVKSVKNEMTVEAAVTK